MGAVGGRGRSWALPVAWRGGRLLDAGAAGSGNEEGSAMAATHEIMLVAGVLCLLGIFAGLLSAQVGTPLLLVFLLVGLLAGDDGLGGIPFDDFGPAYLVGNLALAAGVGAGHAMFNIVFVVVIVSVAVQGWTLAPTARRLRLDRGAGGQAGGFQA